MHKIDGNAHIHLTGGKKKPQKIWSFIMGASCIASALCFSSSLLCSFFEENSSMRFLGLYHMQFGGSYHVYGYLILSAQLSFFFSVSSELY